MKYAIAAALSLALGVGGAFAQTTAPAPAPAPAAAAPSSTPPRPAPPPRRQSDPCGRSARREFGRQEGDLEILHGSSQCQRPAWQGPQEIQIRLQEEWRQSLVAPPADNSRRQKIGARSWRAPIAFSGRCDAARAHFTFACRAIRWRSEQSCLD